MATYRDSSPTADAELEARIAVVLERIRPALRSDGGDIELLGVNASGEVRVRLHGACVGCPSSAITLTVGIERNLKESIAEVTSVVCV